MKIKTIDDLWKVWGCLLLSLIVLMLPAHLFMSKEPYARNCTYNGTEYYVYLIFEKDDFIIASVREGDRMKSVPIYPDYAIENNFIEKTLNPFKRYKFSSEKVIQYVLDAEGSWSDKIGQTEDLPPHVRATLYTGMVVVMFGLLMWLIAMHINSKKYRLYVIERQKQIIFINQLYDLIRLKDHLYKEIPDSVIRNLKNIQVAFIGDFIRITYIQCAEKNINLDFVTSGIFTSANIGNLDNSDLFVVLSALAENAVENCPGGNNISLYIKTADDETKIVISNAIEDEYANEPCRKIIERYINKEYKRGRGGLRLVKEFVKNNSNVILTTEVEKGFVHQTLCVKNESQKRGDK